MEPFVFFVFLMVILAVLYLLYMIARHMFVEPFLRQIYMLLPINPVYKKILQQRFAYYQALTPLQQKDFEHRLKYFLLNKKFYGRGQLTITDEMRVLIGACAVQVTFGFQPLQLTSFNRIVLFPSAYYSRHTKRRHRGEVNTAGIIVFSWEDFLKGYQIDDDGYNTGLHEMAHAVKLEDIISRREYDFLDERVLYHWNRLSIVEMERIRKGENTFLRAYAGTNKEEFFAVCVEQFFEQPEAFVRELPELYETLAQLLNQDPLYQWSSS
jgi:Mlc titration factor MtfA (ptsG expression regulator)